MGVGGDGEGVERLEHGHGAVVPRNVLPLFGRALPKFKRFFWDGKVEVEEDGRIVSMFGRELPDGFSSALAVASILPILERDEFLGMKTIFGGNDIQREVEDSYYTERYALVERALAKRLTEDSTSKLVEDLEEQNYSVDDLSLVSIGNHLADFIGSKFECEQSSWDRHLSGDRAALSDGAKKGAIVFFGRGHCVSCHNGPHFSDFRFHSLGVPQGGLGPHSRRRDIGRAAVTHSNADLYQFRTPPLIRVSETGPYGHNGVFQDLHSVVLHHVNPISIYLAKPSLSEADQLSVGKLMTSRTALLSHIDLLGRDVVNLVEFLESL